MISGSGTLASSTLGGCAVTGAETGAATGADTLLALVAANKLSLGISGLKASVKGSEFVPLIQSSAVRAAF